MAKYEIDFTFADTENIKITVQGATSYPDALAQVRAEAIEGFKQAAAYKVARTAKSDEDNET